MCGIAGVLNWGDSSFTVSEPYLRTMRDTMAHRGPDGSGTWISPDQRVGLAHRRLSIIDLSTRANQPMANEDQSLQIVFNGEIYNHAELRAELEQKGGHAWRTDHSDTEVILHAYEEWGPYCLDKFRGMFAFALWDGRAGELWLVRDRLGLKPLYYSLHDGRLVFASEIKALLADPGQARAINEEALFDYLSFLTVPPPATLFQGIYKLPAASWMRVKMDGTVIRKRYWDALEDAWPLEGKSEKDFADLVLEELRVSVRYRKVSDVPVGVFLSGGLDSSTNAMLFAENHSDRVRTFSIGYKGDHASYPNELRYARQMAERVGAEHHELMLSQDDLIDFLPRMAALQDEPIADPVCFPMHYLAKLARAHNVPVCQVGEGADELFCGYPGWMRLQKLERLRTARGGRAAFGVGWAAMRLGGFGDRIPAEWIRRGASGQPLFWGGTEGIPHVVKSRLLSRRLRERFAGRTSWDALAELRQRYTANTWDRHPLTWMTYLDINLRIPELLNMRVDKMTMGVGLEAREPFLDHKLVELIFSIPGSVKMGNGTLKHLLKKSVQGLVPDEIIRRPKQGFGVPIHEWLESRLGAELKSSLRTFCAATDLLDEKSALRLLQSKDRTLTWVLLNLSLWWKTFFH